MDFLRRISLFCLVLLAAGGQSPLWLHHALFHSACCESACCESACCESACCESACCESTNCDSASCNTSHDHAVAASHSDCGHQHCLSHRDTNVSAASHTSANWNSLAIDDHDCAACYVLSQLNLQSSPLSVAVLWGDVAGWLAFQQQVPCSVDYLPYESRGPPTLA